MPNAIPSGLIGAALSTVLILAGVLPASSQVARPQSSLAIGDNNQALTLVANRGGGGGKGGGGGGHISRGGGGGGSAVRARSGGRGYAVASGSRRAIYRNGNRHNNHWNNNWNHRRYGYWNRGYGWWGGYGLGVGIASTYGYYNDYGDGAAYCMSRFRSYNPSTGTYRGYDGRRHSCP